MAVTAMSAVEYALLKRHKHESRYQFDQSVVHERTAVNKEEGRCDRKPGFLKDFRLKKDKRLRLEDQENANQQDVVFFLHRLCHRPCAPEHVPIANEDNDYDMTHTEMLAVGKRRRWE